MTGNFGRLAKYVFQRTELSQTLSPIGDSLEDGLPCGGPRALIFQLDVELSEI